jgi:ribonuclease III family protein
LLMHEPLDENTLREFSPVVLAYIGDAVFELMVRCALVEQGKRKVKDIHLDTVEHVKASSQALFIREISEMLSDEEKDLVRWGRNSKNQVPKNVNVGDYRLSTGFETLLGYLYLKGDIDRLRFLVGMGLEGGPGAESGPKQPELKEEG